MRIGELASRAGTSARSVRYYEQQGLLLVRRRANGYRDYDEADLLLVREIRSLLVVKVDADDNPGLSRRYGAMSLPSLLLFHGGAERTRIVGAMPRRRLLAELGRFLPGA